MYSGVPNLHQENLNLPTDLNGAGGTRQTPLHMSEDEVQLKERETTTSGNGPCAGSLRRGPGSFTKVKNRRAGRNTDFVGRCVPRSLFELVFVSLRVA